MIEWDMDNYYELQIFTRDGKCSVQRFREGEVEVVKALAKTMRAASETFCVRLILISSVAV